jgi:uncharacterized membrane protein
MITWINLLSYIALIFTTLLWELFYTPSGESSWMVIKAVILVLPLRQLIKKNLYTLEWINFIIILFFIEGVVRAWSEAIPSQLFAISEVMLTLVFFFTSILIFKK